MPFDYTIPVWHPVVVHLPVAALVLAAVASLVWAVSADARWLLTATYLAVAGAFGAILAYVTGDAVREQAEGVPVVDALVTTHVKFAVATLVASLITAAVFVVVQSRARGSARVRWLMFLLSLVCAVLVLCASHIGGLMVWGTPAS